MPLYEYRCQDCGQRYDRRRAYQEADAPASCPTCNSTRSQRMLSRFACIASERSSPGDGGSCAGCSASSCAGCRRS
ncbi:MAG: zinc ribbon domain-containing protein [Anaerolineae bacterium]|nr:zinc ribbon domain-containing protein [Anaerolineae bacterium]